MQQAVGAIKHRPAPVHREVDAQRRVDVALAGNWAGQPLVSYETALKFIRTTKTKSGFRCRAWLDSSDYATGVKITLEQKAQINLKPYRVLPKWNYTIELHATLNVSAFVFPHFPVQTNRR